MDEEHRCGCERRHVRAGRWRRTLGLVALVVGVGVVSSVSTTVVWANHDFPDVPTSSPHHDDISWAVDNDITQGFGDATFRPTQAVSRQTMATFLRRLSAEFEMVSTGITVSGTSGQHSTDCPAGKRPLAGGGNTSSFNFFITDSNPTSTGWSVRWESDDNATVSGVGVTVYALCAPAL